VAAAEAPARPEPTTITVYFLLFAGFTSFISKRCFSHLRSMGPDGVLALSSMRYLGPGEAARAISPRSSRK
jgi:hypothetical protein